MPTFNFLRIEIPIKKKLSSKRYSVVTIQLSMRFLILWRIRKIYFSEERHLEGRIVRAFKKYDYDLRIVYDKGNIVMVDVTGRPGIKVLGCNSMWCFTYGNEYGLAGEQWDKYSYNSHVYAIIDFSQPQDSQNFIYILIKPISMDSEQETVLFDMANNGLSDGNAAAIIAHRVKDPAIFNVFKWEDF